MVLAAPTARSAAGTRDAAGAGVRCCIAAAAQPYLTHSLSMMMMMCCLLVLDSVISTPQWIRQPRPRVYSEEGTYHTRLFRGPSTNDDVFYSFLFLKEQIKGIIII